MIDHVSIQVSDLVGRTEFYEAVLTPLGLRKLVVEERTVGFGKQYPEFWLNLRTDNPQVTDPGAHVAIRAPSNQAVEDFHRLAIACGGRSDGAPGDWQGAMTTYYGAFVLDADGNRIEAVHFPG